MRNYKTVLPIFLRKDDYYQMKVLYILHSTIMGGATISLINLISGIKKKGCEITIVFPDNNQEFINILASLGITYYRCPITMSIISASWKNKSLKNKGGDLIRLIKSKYFSFNKLLEIIKKEKPDIIHTNVGVVQEGFFCARKLGIPHVWHLREYQDRDFNWKFFPSKCIFKRLLKKSNVISITKDIHKAFNLPEDKRHKVIYNGILSKNNTFLEFPKKKYFVCASRVSREKGHDDVIKAFSVFHKSRTDFKLVILGFGDDIYINELKSLSKKLDCDDSVIFEGFTDDVVSYMKYATALIVGSKNEGFGRMTAEAAFAGCLVIGRNTSGTKEILDETGGMKFLEQEDLVRCMFSAANMVEQDYKEIITHAQERAIELYSNENNIEKTHQFYLDIRNNDKHIKRKSKKYTFPHFITS